MNNDPGGGFLNATLEMALSASVTGGLGRMRHVVWNLRANEQ